MTRGQKVWLIAITFAFSQTFLIQAHAGLATIRSNSSAQVFSTGKWAIIPILNAGDSGTPSSLTINAVAKANSWSYFWVKNFGTLQTISFSMTNSTTMTSGNGNYSVAMSYCNIPNMNTAGTCTGTGANYNSFGLNPTTATPAPNLPLTFTLAPGQTIQFRQQYTKPSGNATIKSVISIAVARADVRSASSFIG